MRAAFALAFSAEAWCQGRKDLRVWLPQLHVSTVAARTHVTMNDP
jgi:hypothetical protein